MIGDCYAALGTEHRNHNIHAFHETKVVFTPLFPNVGTHIIDSEKNNIDKCVENENFIPH